MTTNQPEKTIEAIYRRCDVSNNGTENPMTFDEFQVALSAMVAEIIGEELDASQLTSIELINARMSQNQLKQSQRQRAINKGFTL